MLHETEREPREPADEVRDPRERDEHARVVVVGPVRHVADPVDS
jgi:hypothetical protein